MQSRKWNFDNSYTKLPKLFYTKQAPIPVREAKPIIFNHSLADEFAETLLPLIHNDTNEAVRLAQKEVTSFEENYKNHWLAGMKAKLGIYNEETEDDLLIAELLQLMQQIGADYTNTFRSLTLDKKDDADLFLSPAFQGWHDRWQKRLARQAKSKDGIRSLMRKSNPAVIPRNHRIEEALTAAENGNLAIMEKLLRVLSDPYGYTSEQEEYARAPAPASCRYQTFCGT